MGIRSLNDIDMTMNIAPNVRTYALAVMLSGCILLTACGTSPVVEAPDSTPTVELPAPPRVNESAMLPLLGYYHLLQRMTPAELTRERQMLINLPNSPSVRIRRAMVLGMPRTTDLPRALTQLEAVLRSREPEAASLHPLALLLSVQYRERARLGMQSERLGKQTNESRRQRDELQEKLDALADIERSMPLRPNTEGAAP